MSVTEKSRRFDPHLAAEIVVLTDSFGREHHLTIHIAQHEKCAACGHLLHANGMGVTDVEKVIEQAKIEFGEQEQFLRTYAKTRGA